MSSRHSAGANELLDLFDSLLSGDISAADASCLKERLRHDESARLLYVEYMGLHSELLQVLNPDGRPEEFLVHRSETKPDRWKLALASLVAAAIVLMAIPLVWYELSRAQPERPEALNVVRRTNPVRPIRIADAPPPVVARIVGQVEAQWIDSPLAAGVGVGIHPAEKIELGDGTAELEFASGVRCFLSGTSTLAVVSSMACTLEFGTATFHVPESARGFRVFTPGGEITDLGTAFGVSTASDGRSEVHVFRGLVQAAPPGGHGNVLTLSHSCAGRLDPSAKTVSIAEYSPEKFSRPLSVAAGVRKLPSSVRYLPVPPSSLRPGALNMDGRAVLFVEQTGVALRAELLPGTQDAARIMRHQTDGRPVSAEDLKVPAGTLVDSFLLQFGNERANVSRAEISGTVVFAEPILGVVVTGEQLASTRILFGHSGTDYPYDLQGVGLEHDDRHPDRLVISPDRRSLDFSLHTSARFVDQVRILVKHATSVTEEAADSGE